MGVVLWIGSAVLAWAVARIIPSGRVHWAAELTLGVAAACLLGLVATALDFGGWAEIDWRAGLFTLLGALAALGCLRSVTIFRRRSLE
jgi:hypothetical protein